MRRELTLKVPFPQKAASPLLEAVRLLLTVPDCPVKWLLRRTVEVQQKILGSIMQNKVRLCDVFLFSYLSFYFDFLLTWAGGTFSAPCTCPPGPKVSLAASPPPAQN